MTNHCACVSLVNVVRSGDPIQTRNTTVMLIAKPPPTSRFHVECLVSIVLSWSERYSFADKTTGNRSTSVDVEHVAQLPGIDRSLNLIGHSMNAPSTTANHNRRKSEFNNFFGVPWSSQLSKTVQNKLKSLSAIISAIIWTTSGHRWAFRAIWYWLLTRRYCMVLVTWPRYAALVTVG